jgi:DNA (cytosine-5)-methyltransferase 1
MITIGTDCSGIEAPIEALRQLRISYKHIWSCEIDKYARQSAYANYEIPEYTYNDITLRNHRELPNVDIYVCGFPCQTFSLLGKKMGMNDKKGTIMEHCIEVIKVKLPKIFILENVKNFKYIDKGKPYNYLINSLENIEKYNIYSDIYNTKDYGIPQNRERIYIIGIRKDIEKTPYIKPKIKKCKPLKNFLLDHTIYERKNLTKYQKINLQKAEEKTNELSIILSSNYISIMEGLCPTLNTQCCNYYINNYNRCLNPYECLLLQGFKKTFKQAVSNTQLYKQSGNSMSVNVLKEIFKNIFKSVCV